MEAAEEGDELLLVFVKAGKVRVLYEVVGMFMVAGVADVVADVEEVAGGFEEARVGGVEAVQWAESVEEFYGEGGGDSGVGEGDTVVLGQGFDSAAELVGEFAAAAGLVASGVEIGDYAFADSGV